MAIRPHSQQDQIEGRILSVGIRLFSGGQGAKDLSHGLLIVASGCCIGPDFRRHPENMIVCDWQLRQQILFGHPKITVRVIQRHKAFITKEKENF